MPTNNSLNNTSGTHNFSSVNFIEGYNTTVTSAGTLTLNSSSAEQQYFTGTTTHTVNLPVASTMALGQTYSFTNLSTGSVTVKSSGANSVQVVTSGTQAVITCILTSGTTAASWSVYYLGLTGAVNITGGAANQIDYQTATSTTGFISTANNSVLVANAGTQIPTMATKMDGGNPPIDNISLVNTGYVAETLVPITTTTSGTTNTQCITFNISGVNYVAAGNAGASTMTIYSWSGTAFTLLQTISSLTTCTGLAYFVISGTSYITCTSGSNIATFSWNGSSFVSVGSTVATGATPSFMVYYIISGTSYLSVTNIGSSNFTSFSWSGTNWSSLGNTTTGSSPYGIVYYVISGTSYLSVVEVGANSYSTWSWNGSSWVSTSNTQTFTASSSTLFISYFTYLGTSYITAAYQGLDEMQMYSFSAGVWSSLGGHISTGGGSNPTFMFIYTLGTQVFMIVSYQATAKLQIWYFNGTTWVTSGSSVSTGTQPKAGQTFFQNNCMYYVVGNRGTNTFSSYYLPTSPIALSGTMVASIATAPVSSHTATTAFGSSITYGTPIHNTTGYDLMVNISTAFTGTGAVVKLGVGSSSTPTVDPLIPSVTGTYNMQFRAYVPSGYYLSLTNTGTFSGSNPTIQVCPV